MKRTLFHFAYQLSAKLNIRSTLLETGDRGLQTLNIKSWLFIFYILFLSLSFTFPFPLVWTAGIDMLFILWTSEHSFNCNLIKLLKYWELRDRNINKNPALVFRVPHLVWIETFKQIIALPCDNLLTPYFGGQSKCQCNYHYLLCQVKRQIMEVTERNYWI